MKKIFTLLTFLFVSLVSAQVPQGISYQAIAYNNAGNAVVSANVGIRISILSNSLSGTVLYSETHSKTTNSQGLFGLIIGQGTVVSGVFSSINWGANSKFLKVEMDANGGSNYILTGTTPLLSVPFAMTAGNIVSAPGASITLLSPNGTPFQMSVNDNGELSLPTSNLSSTTPTSLYLYGSFNNWDTTTALSFKQSFDMNGPIFEGYKYMTAGTQIKFLAAQNASVIWGGNGLNGYTVLNGNAITIPANGYYYIRVYSNGQYAIGSINVGINYDYTMNYNATGNYFYYTYPANYSPFRFNINGFLYGDNLNDFSLDEGGPQISPMPSNVSHLYKLYIDFNGYGNYTVTP